jgi:GNAT superfamily N-acetyltransferase
VRPAWQARPVHTRPGLLGILETYYDTAPRANATVEEVGPFTLFVKARPDAWDYYARPRLGYVGDITPRDVDRVRARQRELGAPENLEWVHETTPSLLDAVLSSGRPVEQCPLLVLDEVATPPSGADGIDVRMLGADDDLASVVAAVHAGFDGTDDVAPRAATRQAEMLREGLLGMAAAYDGRGTVVGGGSHGPRGATTELTGIAVLPRARRRGVGAAITAALVADARSRGVRTVFLSADDDAVARVYERVGFVRVGTACIAEQD